MSSVLEKITQTPVPTENGSSHHLGIRHHSGSDAFLFFPLSLLKQQFGAYIPRTMAVAAKRVITMITISSLDEITSKGLCKQLTLIILYTNLSHCLLKGFYFNQYSQ